MSEKKGQPVRVSFEKKLLVTELVKSVLHLVELFYYSDFSWRYERFVQLYVLNFELVVFDQIFFV